jgi:hypothetical protein
MQLDKFADVVQVAHLTLHWLCCECITVNRPSAIVCAGCDKQRYSQLGLSLNEAKEMSRRIS